MNELNYKDISGGRYNVGLAWLKIIAAFCVVLLHYGPSLGPLGYIVGCAVPAFMVVSFYLGYFHRKDLRSRLKRILVPFWFWGSISWLLFDSTHRVSNLILQLAVGVPSCRPLYFMFVLTLATVIIYAINTKANTHIHRMTLLGGIVALCVILQYSGVNSHLCECLNADIKPVLGRIVELLPYACLGVVMAEVSKHRHGRNIMFFLGLLLSALSGGVHMIRMCPGFGYQGLFTLAMTVCICSLAMWEGFNYLCNEKLARLAGGLSVGVYFSHVVVGRMLRYLYPMKNGFLYAFIVFVIAIMLTLGMRRIKYIREFAF